MTSVASDLRKTSWGSTLVLNLMRAAAAGVVIGVIGVVGALTDESTPAGNIVPFLFTPLIWPLVYLVFILPLGLLALALAKAGVPWVGLFVGFCSLVIAIGDPILWLLNKVLPERIPIVRDLPFRFINFGMLYLALSQPPLAYVGRAKAKSAQWLMCARTVVNLILGNALLAPLELNLELGAVV